MNWYLKVLIKYAVFSGRARRKEYWYFLLVHFCVAIALTLLNFQLGTLYERSPIILRIYQLLTMLPALAVAVRRLHDAGFNGWWCLAPILNIILMLRASQPGVNKYGANPQIK